MNERIQELAEQAGYIDMGNNHTAYMQFDHEKFAELIVRECADLCSDLDGGENMFSRGIRKHFGVK